MNRELGQHYLTVSLPIGVAMAYSLRFLFSSDAFKIRLLYLSAFVLLFYSLSTLLSRSVYIFALFIFCFFLLAYIFFSKNTKILKKFIIGFFVIIFSLVFIYFVLEMIEFRQAYRIVRLLEGAENEPRYETYLRALGYIIEKPIFGWGTNSSSLLFGNYPHNFSLEVLVSGGIVLFFPILFLLSLYFYKVIKLLRHDSSNPNLLGFLASSLFFFLQWNTSFDLTTSYIFISTIMLFILGYEDYQLRKFYGLKY
jgi:O-antigen ligase